MNKKKQVRRISGKQNSFFLFMSIAAISLGLIYGYAAHGRTENHGKKEVRAMTYNIYSNRKKGINAVAEVIKKVDPDVLSIQEVERFTDINPGNVPAQLSALTHLKYYYFIKTLDLKKGDYGNAILSKYPLSDTVTFALPQIDKNGTYPRAVGVAKVHMKGFSFYFVGTHLDHKSEVNKLAQAEAIHSHTQNLDAPLIMGGDFNSHPTDSAITLLKQWFTLGNVNSKLDYTAPAPHASYTIDYVMYAPSNAFTLKEYKVLYEAKEESDHFPVVGIFQLKNLNNNK